MTVCKLCLRDTQLINKSHIIPDFMYKELYAKDHQFYAFFPNDTEKGKGHVKRQRSGEYEGGLLCEDCDGKLIGGYESYASKAIYGGNLPTDESPIFSK